MNDWKAPVELGQDTGLQREGTVLTAWDAWD